MKTGASIRLALMLCLTVHLGDLLAATKTLQPGPGLNNGTDDGSLNKGKDAGTWGNANDYLYLLRSSCNVGYCPGYIQFNLAGMPTSSVVRAEVGFYSWVFFNGNGWPWPVSPIVSVRRATSPWVETSGDLGTRPTVDQEALDSHVVQTVGGGSYGVPFTEFEGWIVFDITKAYTNWVSGAWPNYGLELGIDNDSCANGDYFQVNASDESTAPHLRPYLSVSYRPNPCVIRSISKSTESIQLTIEGVETGISNSVQRSLDLSANNWTNVHTFVGASASTNWVDALPSDKAFYRVLSE